MERPTSGIGGGGETHSPTYPDTKSKKKEKISVFRYSSVRKRKNMERPTSEIGGEGKTYSPTHPDRKSKKSFKITFETPNITRGNKNRTNHLLPNKNLKTRMVKKENEYGSGLLSALNNKSNEETIIFLIRMTNNLNVRDNNGLTPLQHSMEKRFSPKVIQILLENGADVNMKFSNGLSPLQHAMEKRFSLEVIQILLENGADVKLTFSNGLSPLHFALVNKPSLELVQLLTKNGKNVDLLGPLHMSPLFTAAINHAAPNVIKHLIKNGANVNHSIQGKLLLTRVVAYGASLKSIKALIENGARVDDKEMNGVVDINSWEVAQFLAIHRIFRGIPTDKKTQKNWTRFLETPVAFTLDALIRASSDDDIPPLPISQNDVLRLELLQSFLTGRGAEYTITVQKTPIKVHKQFLMAALGVNSEQLKKTVTPCLEKQKNAAEVKLFFQDLYTGHVEDHKSSKKLWNALRELQGIKIPKEPPLPEKFIKTLYENKSSMDFQIIVQTGNNKTVGIQVNRFMLQMRSKVFKDMFKCTKDNSGKVKDYTGRSFPAMSEVIHYLYFYRLSPWLEVPQTTLSEKQKKARIDVLNELDGVPEFYDLHFPKQFYKELDNAIKRYS